MQTLFPWCPIKLCSLANHMLYRHLVTKTAFSCQILSVPARPYILIVFPSFIHISDQLQRWCGLSAYFPHHQIKGPKVSPVFNVYMLKKIGFFSHHKEKRRGWFLVSFGSLWLFVIFHSHPQTISPPVVQLRAYCPRNPIKDKKITQVFNAYRSYTHKYIFAGDNLYILWNG